MYCEEKFGEIVRIIKFPKRRSTTFARNYAIHLAQGEIIIFVDTHIEVNVGW